MTGRTVTVAWIIDGPKIITFLLDPTSKHGAFKDKYLRRFGFTSDDPNRLAEALIEHAMSNLPGVRVDPPKGPHRIVFEGTVRAPDGRDMPLRTVWAPRDEPPEMRFVTAVPLTRRKTG